LLKEKFPTLWKEAAVVPIFKKGNITLVTNYRPITILNNLSVSSKRRTDTSAKPLIRPRILFCYTNSINMDFLNDTSPGSIVISRTDLPSSVP
jgi:hypothetical protein